MNLRDDTFCPHDITFKSVGKMLYYISSAEQKKTEQVIGEVDPAIDSRFSTTMTVFLAGYALFRNHSVNKYVSPFQRG